MGKQAEHPRHAPRLGRPAPVGGRGDEVLADGEVREHLAALGHDPRPARATRYGGRPCSARPSKWTRPAWIGTMPITARTVVVLPMPLRPSRVTSRPEGTSRLMPNRTWLRP